MVIYVNGDLSFYLYKRWIIYTNLSIVKLSSNTYIGAPIERMQLINDLNLHTLNNISLRPVMQFVTLNP